MVEGLVVDTSVVVAGVCSPRGASFLVLRGILERRIRPAASVPLFVEYESALSDPRIRRLHRLTQAEVAALLDGIAGCIAPVMLHYLWRPQLVDPGDEMVLETAVNAGARQILTFNVKDFTPAAKRFGIAAVLPGDFVLRNRAKLQP
jgi:putative PIN family toxin of toxin-antitoxin system